MPKYILALVLLTFGTNAAPTPDSSAPGNHLADSYAQFGFDVLRTLSSEHPHSNVFISPTSIAVALAMLTNGASGATREAILKTLHSQGGSLEAFNTDNRSLVEQINKATAVQLSMANALWIQKLAEVNPSFAQLLQQDFNAQAERLDFHDPKAVDTINTWVAKNTKNRIPRILDRVDPMTVAILTNAIAFKGKWSIQFKADATQPHDFKTANGTVRKVPMMKHAAEYSYAKDDSLESIRLPYADESFAMYVVLPKDAAAMSSFLDKLTAERFTGLISSLRRSSGTIELPRFTMTYDTTLNGTLAKLGMGIAFNAGSDFSGVHRPPPAMRVSEVRHVSFLKVDEEGTEAAAATSIGVKIMAVRRPTAPFLMVVDHPFFVAIRDEHSGQLLFTGVVSDPQS